MMKSINNKKKCSIRKGNRNKNMILFLMLLVLISLPGEVKCFDIDSVSSFILWIIGILFILALLGYCNRKKNGYEPIEGNIKPSSKL